MRTCEMVLVDNVTEHEHKCGQPAAYRLEGGHLACQGCAVGLANDGIVVMILCPDCRPDWLCPHHTPSQKA